MSRSQMIAMARRNMAHIEAGTVDQQPDVLRVPANNYYDPGRWQLEVDRIFKRLPLMLAASCELPEPGSYKAIDAVDVPVLLTRAADGQVRAFVNMCRHRGAILVQPGAGSARRFTCPYHAWAYDTEGALVGITDNESFGDLDKSCHGLTPLPVAERAGLVFAVLTPNSPIDIEGFLAGYDAVLEYFDFGSMHLVGQSTLVGPNWKVAYDGYLDYYHLPILHKNSFGDQASREALYDVWGPHQRVTFPEPRYLDFKDKPEGEWDVDALAGGVWTLFPHVSYAGGPQGGMLSQLFPGSTPGRSVTIQNHFVREAPADEEAQKAVEQTVEFMKHVVRDEDYATGLGIQRSLETGAMSEVLFGRNEGGGQRFHAWVQKLIEAETPEDTLKIFGQA